MQGLLRLMVDSLELVTVTETWRVLWSTHWPLLKTLRSTLPPLLRLFPGTGPDHLENVLFVCKPTPSLSTPCSWKILVSQHEKAFGRPSAWLVALLCLSTFNLGRELQPEIIVGGKKGRRVMLAPSPLSDFTQQASCSTRSA